MAHVAQKKKSTNTRITQIVDVFFSPQQLAAPFHSPFFSRQFNTIPKECLTIMQMAKEQTKEMGETPEELKQSGLNKVQENPYKSFQTSSFVLLHRTQSI